MTGAPTRMPSWLQLLVTQLILAMTMAHPSDTKMEDGDCYCDTATPCDPTWLPAPNLNRALLGIDIAKKH